jgi:hypothetical protein
MLFIQIIPMTWKKGEYVAFKNQYRSKKGHDIDDSMELKLSTQSTDEKPSSSRGSPFRTT